MIDHQENQIHKMKEKILFYITVFWYLIGYYLIIPNDSPFEDYYFIWEKSSSLLWVCCFIVNVKYDWIILIPIVSLMGLRILLEIPQMSDYDIVNNKYFLNVLSLVVILTILATLYINIQKEIKRKKAEKQFYQAISIEYSQKEKEKKEKGEIIDDTKPYKFD